MSPKTGNLQRRRSLQRAIRDFCQLIQLDDELPGDVNNLCGQITTPLSPKGNGASGSVVTIKFDTGANITVSSCGQTAAFILAG